MRLKSQMEYPEHLSITMWMFATGYATKVNGPRSQIKEMGWAYRSGLTVLNTRDNGAMAWPTVADV